MTLNHGYAFHERIAQGGATVLGHLSQRHPHSTATQWRTRIEAGEVTLDGAIPGPDTRLRSGQDLVWRRPPWQEPPADTRIEVVFEDEALVVVVKPRGLPTLPGAGFLENTLFSQVRRLHPECSPMHRLGRETSGLVVFSRNAAAGAALQAAWREHHVGKRYRALGLGLALQDTYEITAPIGPVPHPLLGTLHAASPSGKPSRSRATVLDRGQVSTLFQVDIESGRPHQIRIHLAFAGHPLLGDPLYGEGGLPLPGSRALPGDGGYLLHAERVTFLHPLTGRPLELMAPAPEDLRCRGERPGDPGPP